MFLERRRSAVGGGLGGRGAGVGWKEKRWSALVFRGSRRERRARRQRRDKRIALSSQNDIFDQHFHTSPGWVWVRTSASFSFSYSYSERGFPMKRAGCVCLLLPAIASKTETCVISPIQINTRTRTRPNIWLRIEADVQIYAAIPPPSCDVSSSPLQHYSSRAWLQRDARCSLTLAPFMCALTRHFSLRTLGTRHVIYIGNAMFIKLQHSLSSQSLT